MIAPEAFKTIDWDQYKQYLLAKYAKSYAVLLFENAKKYHSLLAKVNDIQLIKSSIRNNIIKSLIALSRYQGSYDAFKSKMVSHGIKYVRPDAITTFTRIFNNNAHEGLAQWYNDSNDVLQYNERLYLRFMLLSGVRAMEGINSFNLIVEMEKELL